MISSATNSTDAPIIIWATVLSFLEVTIPFAPKDFNPSLSSLLESTTSNLSLVAQLSTLTILSLPPKYSIYLAVFSLLDIVVSLFVSNSSSC